MGKNAQHGHSERASHSLPSPPLLPALSIARHRQLHLARPHRRLPPHPEYPQIILSCGIQQRHTMGLHLSSSGAASIKYQPLFSTASNYAGNYSYDGSGACCRIFAAAQAHDLGGKGGDSPRVAAASATWRGGGRQRYDYRQPAPLGAECPHYRCSHHCGKRGSLVAAVAQYQIGNRRW